MTTVEMVKDVRCGRKEEKKKAFDYLENKFLPLIKSQVQRVNFYPREYQCVLKYVKQEFYSLLLEENLIVEEVKYITAYIEYVLKSRINTDGYRDYMGTNPIIKGEWKSEFKFRNAKKNFHFLFKREPVLYKGSKDLKKICKIMNAKEDDVLIIAYNLGNSIDSLYKNVGEDICLIDTLEIETDSFENEIIQNERKKLVHKEFEKFLTPIETKLMLLFYYNEIKMTKEDIAEKENWTRKVKKNAKSKSGKIIFDESKVKNVLDKAKEKLKKSTILKELFLSKI